MRKIFFCGLTVLFSLCSGAQQSLLDSLRSLPQKLTIDSDVTSGTCVDKIKNYKRKFASLSFINLDTVIKDVRKLNSELISPLVKNCPPALVVKRLDSMFKEEMAIGFKDSVSLFNTLAFVKSYFSGLVRMQVDFEDSTLKNIKPEVFVQSFESFVILPSNDLPFEVFVSPGKKYILSIAVDGYHPMVIETITMKDTVVMVSHLQKNEAGKGGNEQKPLAAKKNLLEKYWWAFAILLLVAGLIGGSAWPLRKKSPSLSQKLNADLQKELADKDQIIQNNHKQIERMHAEHLALVRSGKETRVGTMLPTSRHFITEVMMTAGPRKKPMNEANSDKDLGEDVCGFITAGDHLLVWLLDGTSDLYTLRSPGENREYFSSRLLAQSIARKLKSHFTGNNRSSLESTMTKVLKDVRTEWLQAINRLPDYEKTVLKNNIRDGNFPECAATVLIGKLSIDGSLDVYRSGDSKLFLFTGGRTYLDTPLADKNDKSNDRVFFRMVMKEGGELDILHNQPLFEENHYDHIETMVGFSDGIGKATEEQFRSAFSKNPDGVREEISYQLQGTEDDKALFIIEIKL